MSTAQDEVPAAANSEDQQTGLSPVGYPSRPIPSTAAAVTLDQARDIVNEALRLHEALEINGWSEFFLAYRLRNFQERMWRYLTEATT